MKAKVGKARTAVVRQRGSRRKAETLASVAAMHANPEATVGVSKDQPVSVQRSAISQNESEPIGPGADG